jgi:hypothetical protein
MSLALLGLGALAVAAPAEAPVTITFDKVETGKPMPSYTTQDVVFVVSGSASAPSDAILNEVFSKLP